MPIPSRPTTRTVPSQDNFPRSYATLWLGFFLVFLLQGCADLKAIQDFADLSADSAEYTTLVDAYVDSPNRQKRYQLESRHDRLEQMVQDRAGQKPALLLRHAAIEKYMAALGALASDNVVDNREEFSRLAAALQSQAGTSPKETEAFGKMAGILTKVASDRWRQRQLRDLIEQSNEPLQEILGTLTSIVAEGFGGDVETEQAAIRNYYTTLAMESTDPAGKAALQEWREFRLAQTEDRGEATRHYADLLRTIAQEHQRLFDQRQDLTNPQVLKQAAQTVKDLKKLLSLVKRAS